MNRSFLSLMLTLCTSLLIGCSSGAYLLQATAGHIEILAAAKDIDALLEQPDTSVQLRTQLNHVRQIRAFSVSVMSLPDNASYKRYAELNRPYAVWNVVAAPVDSLDLKNWCFPFTGCISYKGFYQEENALELADALRKEGLDVAVLGVPAYSTLGFTPDPVLSSFVNYPVGELARLVFHELAHQVLYIADDTTYNESFATAVEELGLEQWLSQPWQETLQAQYAEFDGRRRVFRAMLARAQNDLKSIYFNETKLSQQELLLAKSARIDQLAHEYRNLKIQWNGWSGYDRFMLVDLNNAKLALSGLYSQQVPEFKGLYEWCGKNFPRFYDAAAALGRRSKQERDWVLNSLVAANKRPAGFECSEDDFDAIVQNEAAVFKNQK